ncbi:MAG: phosphoadenylyl-sulfate reductase [Phycisphaerales bacterium JB038]
MNNQQPLPYRTEIRQSGPNPVDVFADVTWSAGDLEHASANQILDYALRKYGDRLGFMTALGYSGIVLMDLLRQRLPSFKAYFIDTGFHFPETLELLERLQEEWKIEFIRLGPSLSDEQIDSIIGPRAWERQPDLCCLYRKVEPMLRVLETKDAWIAALRRDQAPTRGSIAPIQLDRRGTLKIYPLARWSAADCWEYIRQHDLPTNPLHEEGYLSIGCTHCTAPVKAGESERAGRWQMSAKTECGLHDNR